MAGRGPCPLVLYQNSQTRSAGVSGCVHAAAWQSLVLPLLLHVFSQDHNEQSWVVSTMLKRCFC